MSLIISCEHAVNKIPKKYVPLFQGHNEVLASHLAYDLGAAKLAGTLAGICKAPLYLASVSRLVVDCNRSITHRRLFSKFSYSLPPFEREAILTRWFLPYRNAIYREVRNAITRTDRCLHFSVHSFTPRLHNRERKADLGLLYDPARGMEKNFALFLQKEMRTALPSCCVRLNYPYQGISDGLTAALRLSFDEKHYLGIELETNQGLLNPSNQWPESFLQSLGSALKRTIANSEWLFPEKADER